MSRDYLSGVATGVLATLFILWSIGGVLAHEHPINGKKNAAGEWCCGEGDCEALTEYYPDGSAVIGWEPGRYIIYDSTRHSVETIPEREAMPSPDGRYWRCHRPDGSRRCFFAPLPGS